MTRDYLTTGEAAKRLGVSPSQIRRLCDRGKLFHKRAERAGSHRRLFELFLTPSTIRPNPEGDTSQ